MLVRDLKSTPPSLSKHVNGSEKDHRMKRIAVAVVWLCFASTAFAQKVGDTVYVTVVNT